MAKALLANGQGKEAVTNLKQTLSADPRFLEAANQLARVLASHPDKTLRSPREAIALTTRLCQTPGKKNPRFLDTHATAAAALGNFELAVQSAEQALALYKADARFAASVKPLENRLTLFREKQAWVETEWK